jgi:predicted PurR-regulated permease PerM
MRVNWWRVWLELRGIARMLAYVIAFLAVFLLVVAVLVVLVGGGNSHLSPVEREMRERQNRDIRWGR